MAKAQSEGTSGDSGSSGKTDKKAKKFWDSNKVKTEKQIIREKAEELEIALVEWEFFKLYNGNAITALFILIFMSNILINVDHGSLPGCSVKLKEDLEITNLQFGMLGSIVYLGMTFGSSGASWLFDKSGWTKMTLSFTLLMNAFSLVAFTIFD